MNKKDFLITLIIAVLCIGLIVAIVLVKRSEAKKAGPTTAPSTVAHDHNGDGIPDHGDEAHEEEETETKNNTTTTPSGTGNGSGGVTPEDTDIDISIDLEDLPTTAPTGGN